MRCHSLDKSNGRIETNGDDAGKKVERRLELAGKLKARCASSNFRSSCTLGEAAPRSIVVQ